MNASYTVMKQAPARVIGLVLCALAAGCDRGGTPSSHTASVPRDAMHVLDEMNSFAEQVNAERRYRYDLESNCMLKAERLVSARPTQTGYVEVGSAYLVRFDYAPGLGHGLRAPVGRKGAMMSIFDADSRAEIRKMEGLIGALAAACSQRS